jgi:hypothetical protein
MIARLDHLRRRPAASRPPTGVPVGASDDPAAGVLPALADAASARRGRPDRPLPVGAGHPLGPGPAGQVLLAVVWLRVYPTQAVLAYPFGAAESAARPVLGRVLPVPARAGRDTMRMPGPGEHARKRLPALLEDTPGLAVPVGPFGQPNRRPGRRQRACCSGERRRHALGSRPGVDEGSGRVVRVPPTAPGRPPTSRRSSGPGCSGACRRGPGRWAARRTPGRRRCGPGWRARRPGGSRGGSPGRRPAGGTTGRSPGGGSGSGTRSAGRGCSRPWPG